MSYFDRQSMFIIQNSKYSFKISQFNNDLTAMQAHDSQETYKYTHFT